MLWHIGNTTVRTPYRLKEALLALKNSSFHGNLVGKEAEEGFARLLNEKEIVSSERLRRETPTDTSDLGRKWRSAIAQLGFVVQHFNQGQKMMFKMLSLNVPGYPQLTGRPYEITPNGWRLMAAESVGQMQETFLRSLLAYRIPSVIETDYKCQPFSPLRLVIELLLELEKNGAEPYLKFEEMALIVQQRNRDNGIGPISAEILCYRKEREQAAFKKVFDQERFMAAAGENQKSIQTWRDYADLNFRYLKATGIFQSRGRAITLVPEKHTLAELIVVEGDGHYDNFSYVENLWKGAKLPTDDKIKAVEIVKSLYQQLLAREEDVTLPDIVSMTLDELTRFRLAWEERLLQIKELNYAVSQYQNWPDIVLLMKAFLTPKPRRPIVLSNGEEFIIPSAEAPAYFEWIIWRAFLAINSLTCPPWEARNFKIDQDFLPLSHAPSRMPDMKFVFEEYHLVVEVTLTGSSRQEAAEGEPVRRHVAVIAQQLEASDKRVYCLFIAPSIDSNTAETFKIGNWYKADDSKLPLQIVPIPLRDFIRLFEAGFQSSIGRLDAEELMKLLVYCRSVSNTDAPEWKKMIEKEIEKTILRFQNK